MKFKKPVRDHYIGKQVHGCPYFYPRNYVPTIIKVYKKVPMVRRTCNFNLGGYHIQIGWPVMRHNVELGWKWKYDTVRYEWAPQFGLYFFGFEFHWWDNAPRLSGEKYSDNDKYYEMWLWTYKGCDGDIEKAKETWGWKDMEGNSTWDDKYINYEK